MKDDAMFVKSIDELVEAIIKFQSNPSVWREVVGNNPIYFVHLFSDGKHLFGLSKFCALKDLSLDDYIAGGRKMTNGTKTQEHIASILAKSWTPRSDMDKAIIKAFDLWITRFFPNYKIEKAMLMDINHQEH